MKTDTSEKGLEELIVRSMTGRTDVLVPAHEATETSVPVAGGTGWLLGDASHYDREYCVDLVQLRGFFLATQEHLVEALSLQTHGPTRRQFLARLQGEISKRGVIDVLRNGIKHGPHHINLFYGTPSPDNPVAVERFACNRFSVTRQLRYSRDETQLALDLCLFINGLPIATFELKNSLTKQTVDDAVQQYKRDRDPRERLFEFDAAVLSTSPSMTSGCRCVHISRARVPGSAVRHRLQRRCGQSTQPRRADDRLPSGSGFSLHLDSANILENYAQVVEEKNEKTGKKTRKQIFPRYHQLDVVRKLPGRCRGERGGQALSYPAFCRERQIELDCLASASAHRPAQG